MRRVCLIVLLLGVGVSAQTPVETTLVSIRDEALSVLVRNAALKTNSRLPKWVTDAVTRIEATADKQIVILSGPPKPPLPSVLGGGGGSGTGLVGQVNLTYVGGCRVPQGTFGSSNFGWSGGGDNAIGGGIAWNPANSSLFITGNHRVGDGGFQGSVAEIAPCSTWVNSATASSLNTATVLQNFYDLSEGRIAAIESGEYSSGGYIVAGGIHVYGSKVIGTVFHQYDGSNVMRESHFSHSTTLSSSAGASAFDVVYNSLMAGYVGGWMTGVPAAWQTALGGTVLTGQCCLSVISRTSHGMAAFAFEPNDISGTTTNTLTAYPLVYYDDAHETLGAFSATPANAVYGGATMVSGMALIPGSNTLLYWGTHSTAYCYGNGTTTLALVGTPYPDPVTGPFVYCYDPDGVGVEGVHTYPNHYQIWAYDLRDLAAVKAGTKLYYQPIPYAYWTITLPIDTSQKIAGGMTIDPATGNIYVSQYCAEVVSSVCYPIIHKFTVTVP